MKTTGLNYLEAVQALDEGKCEKIESRGGAWYELDPSGNIVFITNKNHGILLRPSVFLDEWSLIGVKQKISGTIKWGKDNDGHIRPIEFMYDSGDFEGLHVDVSDFPDKHEMKITLEWPE